MKSLKFILLAACAVLCFGACSKSDDYSMEFSANGLYFQWGGQSQTISYTTINAASVTLKSATTGWTCTIDEAAHTITITPPVEPETESAKDEQRQGDMVITLISKQGSEKTSLYTIKCYIVGDEIIMLNAGGEDANCYVITEPMEAYSLDVSRNGGGQPISGVNDVIIVWQSYYGVIEHLVYDSEKKLATFYVDALTEEDDDDVYVKEDGKFVVPGANAVIAAVDSSDNVLWSWHLWFVKESDNPLNNYSTYANGVTFMNINLGAFTNSNGATDSTSAILDSYGLYYQWGRKDPFLRPFYHDCSGGESEYVFGESGTYYIDLSFEERSSSNGTIEYSIAHPMAFITNASCVDADNGDGVGDWLYNANNNLWSNTSKSLYDPCPYGWKVPAASDFDCLSLTAAEDQTALDTARNRYGWMLSDGVNNYFYLGAGFRSYYDGAIHNMNYKEGVYPSQPEPWEGYYWTAGTTKDGKQSTCMYFDLTTTRTINKFNLNYPSKRANAMQIRCVKVK